MLVDIIKLVMIFTMNFDAIVHLIKLILVIMFTTAVRKGQRTFKQSNGRQAGKGLVEGYVRRMLKTTQFVIPCNGIRKLFIEYSE